MVLDGLVLGLGFDGEVSLALLHQEEPQSMTYPRMSCRNAAEHTTTDALWSRYDL